MSVLDRERKLEVAILVAESMARRARDLDKDWKWASRVEALRPWPGDGEKWREVIEEMYRNDPFFHHEVDGVMDAMTLVGDASWKSEDAVKVIRAAMNERHVGEFCPKCGLLVERRGS